MAVHLTTGAILGETYELKSKLGEGGMGVVWVAQHLRLPKEVAIKVLRGAIGTDADTYARFRREAEIASSIGHPNIVEALDFNVLEDGTPYLVLELLRGRSLREALHDERLELELALTIAGQIASGLGAAHRREIVHRDLKPENVFLCQHDPGAPVHTKILDFGISKMHGSQSLTRDGVLMGTPQYMAPEQATSGVVDPRTDQFALAVIVYEMLTGLTPFVAEQAVQVLYQVVHTEARPLSDHRPDLPRALGAVLERGLAKRIEARWPDITELARQLWQTSGLQAPREALALLASSSGCLPSTTAGRRSTAGAELANAPTLASDPVLPADKNVVAASTGPPEARPSPSSTARPGTLANAATLEERVALPSGPTEVASSPPASRSAGPPVPLSAAPARPSRLGLVIVVAAVSAALAGSGVAVWLLSLDAGDTVSFARGRLVDGSVNANRSPRDAVVRQDAIGSSAVPRAPKTPRPPKTAKTPRPPKTAKTQRPPKTAKTERPPKTAKTQRPPKTAKTQRSRRRLPASQAAQLGEGWNAVRARRFRDALTVSRLRFKLPKSQRWRMHQVLMAAYCGLQELRNVRGQQLHLSPGQQRRPRRICKKVWSEFDL